jgi:hypothetical protein
LADNRETVKSLEQLLESLIKMVGKTNGHIDSLNQRVNQIEWSMEEFQLKTKEQDVQKRSYMTNGKPQTRCSQNPSPTSHFTISV